LRPRNRVANALRTPELTNRDSHTIAAHVTDVDTVNDEEHDDAEYEIGNQRAGNLSAAENCQCQSYVDDEANDNADGEIDLLLRMYQGLEGQRTGAARFRWHVSSLWWGGEIRTNLVRPMSPIVRMSQWAVMQTQPRK
jgi:hypothetical protein